MLGSREELNIIKVVQEIVLQVIPKFQITIRDIDLDKVFRLLREKYITSSDLNAELFLQQLLKQ